MKQILKALTATALILGMAAPAGAITNGQPDNGEHPYVGQFLFYVPDAIDDRFDDPGSWFTCTGTLLDDTTVLTAGHCTFAVGMDGSSTLTADSPLVDTDGDGTPDNGDGGNDIWISFAEEPDFGILPMSSTYERDENDKRYQDWSTALNNSGEWIRGTSHPHPDYNDFAFVLADAGIVELEADPGANGSAMIASLGYLDSFKTAKRSENRFTPVGYGLNSGFPAFSGGDTREKANVMLVNLNGTYGIPEGTSVVFSGNKGKPHTGGTCFGDSGGPVFEAGTNRIVAVTSFGITLNCAEPGGYYRIDQADDHDFISGYLGN